MDNYAARICWNSASWRVPTGEAAKWESLSYTRQFGFGHEEWLFSFERLLNGRKYGYLQPIKNSWSRLNGSHISLSLYTIRPDSARLAVGQLKNCRVLTEPEAEAVARDYQATGRLAQMMADVEQVHGRSEAIPLAHP